MPPLTFMSWNMLKPSQAKVNQSEYFVTVGAGAKKSKVARYAFYEYVAAVVGAAQANAFVILEFVKGKKTEARDLLQGFRGALGANWAAISVPIKQRGVDPIAIFWDTTVLTPLQVAAADGGGFDYEKTANVAVAPGNVLMCGATDYAVARAAGSLPTEADYPSTGGGVSGGKPGFYCYFSMTGAMANVVLAGYHAPTPGMSTPLGGYRYASSYVFQKEPLHGIPSALPDLNPNAGVVFAGGDFNVPWGEATPYTLPPPPSGTTSHVAYDEFTARTLNSPITNELTSLKQVGSVPPVPDPAAVAVRSEAYDHIFIGTVAPTGGRVVDAITDALPAGSVAIRNAVQAFATTAANAAVGYYGAAAAFPPTTVFNSFAFYRTVVSDHLPVVATAVVP